MHKFITNALLIFTLACSSNDSKKAAEIQAAGTPSEADDDATILQKMQGTWVSKEDSLSLIEVRGSEWKFRYVGTDTSDIGHYTIGFAHALPRFVDPKVKADFVFLTHATDTMHYEIFGLTQEIMSLMYYPKMNIQVYNRVE